MQHTRRLHHNDTSRSHTIIQVGIATLETRRMFVVHTSGFMLADVATQTELLACIAGECNLSQTAQRAYLGG